MEIHLMKSRAWLLMFFSFAGPGLLGGQVADKQVDHQGAKEIFIGLGSGSDEVVVVTPHPEKNPTKRTPHKQQHGTSALSLLYWIELRGPSTSDSDRVTESRTFKSGERIRFYFTSSTGGYIALAQWHKDGTLALLFPRADKGLDDTKIQPSVERILPSETAWLKFDANPYIERVVILFADSAKRLHTLIQTTTRAEMPEEAVQAQLGSKDLLLEVEETVPSQIGTYLVSRDGGPVIRNIFLKHQ
jgi:hypothetical protein